MTKRDVNNIFVYDSLEKIYSFKMVRVVLISSAYKHKQLSFILSIHCVYKEKWKREFPFFYFHLQLSIISFSSRLLLSFLKNYYPCLMLLRIFGDIYFLYYMTVLSFGSEGRIRWGVD